MESCYSELMDARSAAPSTPCEPWVQFQEARHSLLRNHVRSFWEVHGTFGHVRERVLPRSDIFVLVNLGAPHALIKGRQQVVYADAWVAGIQTAPLITTALGQTDVWGASLTAQGAQLLFGSTAVLADSVVSFCDLGEEFHSLSGRLREARSFHLRCAMFEAHLGGLSAMGRNRWRSEIGLAIDRLSGEFPRRISDVAAEIGWSRKHLRGQFLDHLGIAPKKFARIARFERALQLMAGEGHNFAELSVAAGYYDQAHFAHEFADFAGITPSEYLRSRVAGADYGFVDADG